MTLCSIILNHDNVTQDCDIVGGNAIRADSVVSFVVSSLDSSSDNLSRSFEVTFTN